MFLRNVFLHRIDQPNKDTGLIFKPSAVIAAIDRYNNSSKIGKPGEFLKKYPSPDTIADFSFNGVDLQRVSHMAINLRLIDNCVYGNIQTLNTTCGLILNSVIPECFVPESQMKENQIAFIPRYVISQTESSIYINSYQIVSIDAINVTECMKHSDIPILQ